MTESVIDFLEKAKAQISKKYDQGLENISGHNGPYQDKETGVRAQAHFIVLLSNLDRAKPVKQSEALVSELVHNLLNSVHRLDTVVFNQRTKPGKDEVNGVIGIAWIIEAMCCACEVYQNKEAHEFLAIVENDLRFNSDRGLWYRPVLKDNKYYNTIDETFNHQLWLAYALVYKSTVLGEPISANTLTFFKKLKGLLQVDNAGLIKHAIVNTSTPVLQVRHALKSTKDWLNALLQGKSFKYKEYGYHLFNMYAFARIKSLGQEALFVNYSAYNKARKFCTSTKLLDELTSNSDAADFYMRGNDSGMKYNRYGLPYNVAGFEFLYVNKILELAVDSTMANNYLRVQYDCYGLDEKGGNSGKFITEDVSNLMLRSYELSFLIT